MKTPLLVLAGAFACLSPLLPSALAARNELPGNPTKHDKAAPLEFPMMHKSERAELLRRAPPLSRYRMRFPETILSAFYSVKGDRGFDRHGRYAFEAFGVHVDSNPYNGPEPMRVLITPSSTAKGPTLQASKPSRFPFGRAGAGLAAYSRKNVLVSARIENRQATTPGWPERRWSLQDFIREIIEPNGGKVVPIGDDTLVLLEAPGREIAFTLGHTRPIQYEQEREAWLDEHPYYSPQGLIYQPTAEFSDQLPELSENDPRIRHAAALLAKLTGKEVFVQASAEKRKFAFHPWRPEATPEEIRAQLEVQLSLSSVMIMELDAHSLALVKL